MGMALAAAITKRVTEAPPGPDADLSHAAMDFARVSRAVRMTFALQSRLVAEFKDAGQAAKAGQGGEDPIEVFGRPDIVDHDVVRKRQLRGVVERLAQGAALERETVERLVREAGERLEDDGFFRDITKRPISEMVALICKDLVLQPNWEQLSGEWWAQSEIKQPPPGSPYAGWQDRPDRQARRDAPETASERAPPPLVPSG